MKKPVVMITSWPPRLCGIATFAEEAVEFIKKAQPDRPVFIISHTDGRGAGVFPIIDLSKRNWYRPVLDKIHGLDPEVVHIQHEYGLYNYTDGRGRTDFNAGFLRLLEGLADYPTVVEPHTVHGRLREDEADFVYQMCNLANVVILKCHYQKWRLEWNFGQRGWEIPRNVAVVPHGARSDKRWPIEEVPRLREELGLNGATRLGEHLVGLVGWIQSNKRWDILTSMWEDIAKDIKKRTGQEWDLLAAGAMRDPAHRNDYEKYRGDVKLLEKKGLAHYYEFIPRGDIYYKVMAICDFVVVPSVDETQSGTLARIIALNKPFITTAPMEGLTAQALESEGGLLFTNKEMLREKVIQLACDEDLRLTLGWNLRKYLDEEVKWEVVVQKYEENYKLAAAASRSGSKLELPLEF